MDWFVSLSIATLAVALVVARRIRRAALAHQDKLEADAWAATDRDSRTALERCQQAIANGSEIYGTMNPGPAIAYYCLAVHYHREGMLALAMQQYRTAIGFSFRAEGNHWCGYRAGLISDRAWCDAELGQFDEARAWLERAESEARNAPRDEAEAAGREVLMAKAFVALRMKQTGEAEGYLRQLLQHRPEGPAYRENPLRPRSSARRVALGRYSDNDAYRMLEKVFERYPDAD